MRKTPPPSPKLGDRGILAGEDTCCGSRVTAQLEIILSRLDEARAARGLPLVRVGFNYAAAIQHVQKMGYRLQDIADCIGCSEPNLQRILAGSIPNHIAGELLWGLCVQLFGEEQTKKLVLEPAHNEPISVAFQMRIFRAL
jgi:hypothetical protein